MQPPKHRDQIQQRAKLFSEWLSGEVERRGWTGSEFARRVGMSHTQVGRWRSGEALPMPHVLQSIAQALGLPYELVARKAGYDMPGQGLPPGAAPVIWLPEYDQPVSAGPGAFPVDYFPAPITLAPIGRRCYVFPVRGTCMEPEIKPGDRVVVDPDATVRSGDIAVLRRDGDYIIKRLLIESGRYFLAPNNGERTEINAEADLIGKVIYVGRAIK